MIWLIFAIIGLAAKVSRETKKQTLLWLGGTVIFYCALIAWYWLEAGEQAFRGSETSLMGWFMIGLAFFLISELLPILSISTATWMLAAHGLAAGAFALGFDVFQPNDYMYVPGSILAVLVFVVAAQAWLKLANAMTGGGQRRILLAIYISVTAILVFAATVKTIDRGWALPWAYLASGGALLFAAGQLWMGWSRVLGKQAAAPWVQVAAINVGQLMMVAAAFFVYREFL